MAPKEAGTAPAEGALSEPRRSLRVQARAIKPPTSPTPATSQGPTSTSRKRKRTTRQSKSTKAQPRKRRAANKKGQVKKGQKAAPKKKDSKKTASQARKDQKYGIKPKDNDPELLPHNLGPVQVVVSTNTEAAVNTNESDKGNHPLKNEAAQDAAINIQDALDTVNGTVNDTKAAEDAPKSEKAKRAPSYRLTPGKTPFPKHPHPTPAECEEVNRLLSEVHGEVKQPATIPEPSLTVTGCGEVPSVLDALIRTLLSGATSGNNSALAFDGLVKRFGILQDGIGKGSVNWDAVRQAPLEVVYEAIKRGGLADTKSKSLKAILDKVYEENQKHGKGLQADGFADSELPKISSEKAEQLKEYEIACAEQHVLSLNHLHTLPTEQVMTELVQYPGIGPKTAACVILFCLQRPCFAVDTHIFRICKWLGWVPPKANEVTAFSHLEVRMPDKLKYSLHQLLIRHGKSCPRCRAITGENSSGWEDGCKIDHLVQRTGVRKPGAAGPSKRKTTRGTKRKGSAGTSKKKPKARTSGKWSTSAKDQSTRRTRSKQPDTAPLAAVSGNTSTTPAAAQEETAANSLPTAEKNILSDASIVATTEQNSDGSMAVEMGSASINNTPEDDITGSSDKEEADTSDGDDDGDDGDVKDEDYEEEN